MEAVGSTQKTVNIPASSSYQLVGHPNVTDGKLARSASGQWLEQVTSPTSMMFRFFKQ